MFLVPTMPPHHCRAQRQASPLPRVAGCRGSGDPRAQRVGWPQAGLARASTAVGSWHVGMGQSSVPSRAGNARAGHSVGA